MDVAEHPRDKAFVSMLYELGARIGEIGALSIKDMTRDRYGYLIDLEGKTARLRIENSKNKEPWVVPLAGRLWEIVQECLRERRLDCPYVFHHNGRKIGDFKKSWKTACIKSGLGRKEKIGSVEMYVGTIPHDLRRCTARNLSRANVPEALAMKITGHKTNSMYRRYRIVDENELREAQEKLQAHLVEQVKNSKVASMQAAS